MPVPSRRKPRLRVGAMLAALAALPVLTLMIFAGTQIVAVTETQQDLSAINEATDDLTDLIALETALDSEVYWSEGTAAVAQYGIPNDFVSTLLGIDLESSLVESQEAVDAALIEIGDPRLSEAVASARLNPQQRAPAKTSLTLVSDGIVADEIDEASDELLRLASGLSEGEELMQRAETLTEANKLRSCFSELVSSLFLLIVYGGDQPTESLIATGTAFAGYNEAADELGRGTGGDDEFNALRASLASDEAVLSIYRQADDALASADGSSAESLDFESQTALFGLADTFGVAIEASDRHLELVQTATDDLRTELELTRGAENLRARVIGLATLAVVIMTLLALTIVTRSIVGPLRRLGAAAESLSTGERLRPVKLSGPKEIQAAAHTLNQAAVNLQRAEAQALALADGRLDDACFDAGASGTLGRSLDVAVARLRLSLSDREEFRQRLAHEAAHDGLTGLPNRKASIATLERALLTAESTDSQVAVLFIDVDGFKSVNDTHGHGAGDHLLNTVAHRLISACRPGDRVGRLGGDEFLIVAEPVESLDFAHALAERMRSIVSSPTDYDGQLLDPTVSIGVAIAGPGSDADAVIREADFAVYEAKNAGRNQTKVFNDDMRARLAEEADLSDAISDALINGEFHLEFQPIVVPDEGVIRGYEALLRWTRPGVGAVPPDEFIGFAERSDLILDIDRWVLNEGIRYLADFKADETLCSMGVSLNVSGRHLLRADLYSDIEDALARWEVQPERLTIEVTESALLDDLAEAAEVLQRIRSLGVRVAIDDFGTGYTSLGHLRDLPADVLKIDRSFTQNLHRQDDISLVRLVTETGHLLGMDITVEGVETREQEELLTYLGVDCQQGFRFGRPSPFGQLKTEYPKTLV